MIKKTAKMIEFLKHLFNRILPKNQHHNDEYYYLKTGIYYFALWYIIYLLLLYIIYKNL